MFKKYYFLVAVLFLSFSSVVQAEDLRILKITPGWVETSPPNITKGAEGITYAEFTLRITVVPGGKFHSHVTDASGKIQKVRVETEILNLGEYIIKLFINNIPEARVIFEDHFKKWEYKVTPAGIIRLKD